MRKSGKKSFFKISRYNDYRAKTKRENRINKKIFPNKEYVNLEDPQIRMFALEDPRGFLNKLKNGAVIDEIQRAPELLSYIQAIVDETKNKKKFVLTGSNQLKLINSINQSLAGRTALIKLFPFSLDELLGYIGKKSKFDLIYKGFYPRIYDKKLNPTQFLSDYFETYIQKDIKQLVNIRDLNLFVKFVKLCAGRSGQILNILSLSNDVGVSHTTVRNWLSFLEAGYVIYFLRPYYENVSKRLIKSPKLYFYDVGLASFLIGIMGKKELETHPLFGSLYETFVVGEIMKYLSHRNLKNEVYFLKDNSNIEIDILLKTKNQLFPIEIKSSETVNSVFFRNFKIYAKYFNLKKGALVYSGREETELNGIEIVNHLNIPKLLSGII
ncbi:MAG: ATP-binding protein [Elusimicrobia bacterium]|nr:ATP-binding protein [Elusimicrobiota bacterium]